MTMLYSLFTSKGIVFAADSRIVLRGKTDERGKPRPKVIRVRRCGMSTGLIGYYGLAQVKGKPMSDWLSSLIASWRGSHEPEDFADLVVENLNRDAWTRERREVSGFHFGAFRRRASHVEPVCSSTSSTRPASTAPLACIPTPSTAGDVRSSSWVAMWSTWDCLRRGSAGI